MSAGDVKTSPLFDGGGDKWEGLLLDFGGWMWPGMLEKVVGVVAKGLEGRVQLIGQLPIQHLKVNNISIIECLLFFFNFIFSGELERPLPRWQAATLQ